MLFSLSTLRLWAMDAGKHPPFCHNCIVGIWIGIKISAACPSDEIALLIEKQHGNTGKHMKQLTVFTLENCLLGVDSTYVHTIQPVTALVKMPQKEDQLLLGMMKLPDGRFMHVINSVRLFGLSPSSAEEAKAIVFLNGTLLMGLIVSSDIGIWTVDETTIAGILPLSRIKSEYFAGTVMDKNENVILLLNMDKVLSTLTSSPEAT